MSRSISAPPRTAQETGKRPHVAFPRSQCARARRLGLLFPSTCLNTVNSCVFSLNRHVGRDNQGPYVRLRRLGHSGIVVCLMDKRWLSAKEIAKYLGVSKDTIYSWITDRSMPSHIMVGLRKVRREGVDGWVKLGGSADQGPVGNVEGTD